MCELAYSSNASQSINSASTTIIDFEDKQWDSHNAVTTGASWKFTAPISGIYSVSAIVAFGSLAWTAGHVLDLYLFKNGSNFKGFDIMRVEGSVTDVMARQGTRTVRLLAGQYIDVRLYHNRGSASTLNGSAEYVNISIDRIGNY